jgi:hypothetical protein
VVKITVLEAKKRLKRFGWRNKVRAMFEPLSRPGTCYPSTMKAKNVEALIQRTQSFEGRLAAQKAHFGVYVEMHSHVHGPGRLFFETCVERSLTADQLEDSAKKGRAIHVFSRKTVRTPMKSVRPRYNRANRKMIGTPHYFHLRQRSYRQKILKRRIAKFRSMFEVQAAKAELAKMCEEAKAGRSKAATEKWVQYREAKRRQQATPFPRE